MSNEKARPKGDSVDNSFAGNDPREIDLDNPVERAYWMKALDTSEVELRTAVRAVGPFAQKVKDFLKQR